MEADLDDFSPRRLHNYPRGNNVPSTSDKVSFEKTISGFSSENVKNFRMEFDFFFIYTKVLQLKINVLQLSIFIDRDRL